MSGDYNNPFAGRQLELSEIQGIDDTTMRKTLVANLWDDERFAVFLEMEVVDQAYDVMRAMSAWVATRVSESPKKSQERTYWCARSAQMDFRLSQLKAEIKRLNVEENESADAKIRRITRFAYELAAALELRGGAGVLELIKIDDNCTGTEFLNNYQAKLAKKAAAA